MPKPPLQEIVAGTRGSELALVQTRAVAEALQSKCGVQIRAEIIRAGADETSVAIDRRAGRKGLFTFELEQALLEKRIDVAIHSAKDLPSMLRSGTIVAGVLPRGPVEDVLITKAPATLEQLRPGATIASGSVRRYRQVRWLRPDLAVTGLRGNVPTRLRKFVASDWDAIILARAGLERLGFSSAEFEFEGKRFFRQILPVESFLPAGGQGTIAVQICEGDASLANMIAMVNHAETHRCLRAEREFLKLLQGDCDLPIGVLAMPENGEIELRAQLFFDAISPKTASARGGVPEAVAAEVFSKIDAS